MHAGKSTRTFEQTSVKTLRSWAIISTVRAHSGFSVLKLCSKSVKFDKFVLYQYLLPKITLLVFRVRCGTLNCNLSEESECVMEFPMSHFKAFRDVFKL